MAHFHYFSGSDPELSVTSSTLYGQSANKVTFEPYQVSSFIDRGRIFDQEKSPGTSERSLARVLLSPVHCAQEIWGLSPSNRSQGLKSLCNLPSFSHGDGSFDPPPIEGRRVDNQYRLVRRIPAYSSTSQLPEVLASKCTEQYLSVSGNLLWAQHCPKSIYKTTGSSSSLLEGQRDLSPSLPGRLVDPGWHSLNGPNSYSGGSESLEPLGLISQQGKVRTYSPHTVYIPGDGYRPSSVLDSSNRIPTLQDCQLDIQAAAVSSCTSTSAAVTDWQSESCVPVCSTGAPSCASSTVLHEGSRAQSEDPHRRLGQIGQQFSVVPNLVDGPQKTGSGSSFTSSRSRDNASHRCQPPGLGSVSGRSPQERDMVCPRIQPSHLSPGTESSSQGFVSIDTSCDREISPSAVRQCHSSGLHSQRRGHPLHCIISGDQEYSSVVCPTPGPPETFLSSRTPEFSGRSTVMFVTSPGDRVDTAFCNLPQTTSHISPDRCGPVCHETEQPNVSICQSVSRPHSLGSRCPVSGMGEHAPVRLPSIQANSGGVEEATPIIHPDDIDSPSLAEPVMVPGSPRPPLRTSSPDSSVASTPETATGEQVPSESPDAPPSRVATIRARLRQDGFSGAVARYAAAPQRRSSLRLYQSHWRTFSNWCLERDIDPSQTTVQQIADFLVYLHEEKSFAPSTIANYRTSIASTLGSVDGVPLSMHPCLSHLIKAFTSARPPGRPRVPEWDLSRVLRILRSAEFEPPRWDTQQNRMRCTWKTVFLLALATSSRRGELQALSRSPRDLIFSDAGMSMRVVPGFLAKTAVPGMDPAPFMIPSLEPFSGRDTADRLLCPVRMVRKYLEFTGGLTPKARLFKKVRGEGSPTAQTISSWIKACVKFTHQHRPDVRVVAHEVRRMSASWAFHGGAHSVDDILQAGTWASHTTFTSFYLADVRLQPDGKYRMHPIVARRQLTNF